jgi:multiple sugar transport system permease protein
MNKFSNKDSGIINFMDLKKTSIKVLYWSIFSLLVFLALICLLPPLWIFISSLKTVKELYQIPATLFPERINLRKIIKVWNQLDYLKYYINTLKVVVGAVLVTVIVNGLAGFALSRLKPIGSKVYFTIMLWTMLMPTTLSLVPLFKNMIHFPLFGFNLTNTYWPMWLVCGASAFYVLIFKSFFDGIPMPLIEAARLDGCGHFRIFTRIMLPLSKPIIGVVVIFTVNGVWSDFLLPYLVLNDKNAYTVMLAIFSVKNNANMALDLQLMTVVFAIIPPIIIFCIFQKYIMKGVNVSGIKG